MSPHRARAIDVHVVHPKDRSVSVPFQMISHDVTTLLIEVVQLVKLSQTQATQLQAIRTDASLRTQRMKDIHEEVMVMIDREYAERAQQTALINENIKLLIQAAQYELATQVMTRLTEILRDSPLKTALEFRKHRID